MINTALAEAKAPTGSIEHNGWMNLQVVSKKCIAVDVHEFELALATGEALPAAEPGSHITLLTPNGLTRRYSVCNHPGETAIYRIAVKREAQGLGGSRSLVDQVQMGDVLSVSPPSNYFLLRMDAPSYWLIAGGIGITPILSMARALKKYGRPFKVLYLTQMPDSAAYRDELQSVDLAPHATVHHNHGDPAQRFDLAAEMQACPADAHIYCCGPRRLMDTVKELSRGRPTGTVHFEDFGSSEVSASHVDTAFKVKLSKTGQLIDVPCGKTILDALREARILVPSSCESGTCGACRTRLVAGVADHRDYVLDEDQYDKEIMICVSRAKSSVIEIDL
jgi:phthalate 4,5-dioxygenase reductase subunit